MNRKVAIALVIVAALGALGWGASAWHHASTHVTTDDAYVEGIVGAVSSKVAGHVVELRVLDNQTVHKGDLLLRIDPRDYQARREQARAAIGVAEATVRAVRSELPLTRDTTRAQVQEVKAALEGALVAVQTSQSGVEQGRAAVEARRAAAAAMRAEVVAAQATERKTALEYDRMKRLLKDGYVSRREHDDAHAANDAAVAHVEAARRRFAQAEQETQQTEAELVGRGLLVEHATKRVAEARGTLARAEGQLQQLGVKEAEAGRAEATLQQARADLAMAELQLEYTDVRAPIDGVIAKKSVELGQVAQVGQPLLAIVPLHDVWIVANFKETQLARMRPGMRAEIAVDGVPGRVFVGTLNSLAAGTGARFSLLPPENATGNWVKVVQRIPVKILLDQKELRDSPLRAGMSCVVTIRVK
ncbi:MAG: HlyD family secretion protein [Candidatus Rokuibacteriota bacterium]